ncbi:MAG: acyl-acyl-carrier-protein-phospholipid O-acyltransferase / long-chain-fatty-acid--acyl-carrier-protein ligase [Elusimicrobia bacterium]|nr:MAG: acyl-acyl-carrier-protein-phospholipid O-acyltransferase / long-chain-fatty-acid--acyl-carrier-protein ligase [Elusimicrobiota bacterium]
MGASTKSKGFRALLWSQALSTFTDNAFKTYVALWAVSRFGGAEAGKLIAAAGALFILPFIVLSPVGGAWADRFPKRGLLLKLKAAEFVLMLAAVPALAFGFVPGLFVLLAALGAQAALFSPAKLAVLPELVEEEELSYANGLVQTTSFLGIVLGTLVAGILAEHAPAGAAAAGIAAASGLGLFVTFLLPELAAKAGEATGEGFLARLKEDFASLTGERGIFEATVGAAYFWFLGAALQMNLLVYGRSVLGLGETALGGLQAAMALGIGAGSFAAGRLSREQVELGLVPAGAAGLTASSAALAFCGTSPTAAGVGLFVLGFSAGLFVVPLQAFIQQRSPADRRGRVIAAGNMLAFSGVLAASGFLWAMEGVFRLSAAQVYLVAAAMSAVVAVFIAARLPDFLLRLCLYPLANLFYRIEVEGGRNVPLRGGALLIANHVSFLDAVFITAACRRLPRFVMFRGYYEHPVLHPFVKAMGCLPIADVDGPRAIVNSLKAARARVAEGEVVCIFAEGEITRHGQMLRFRKGFEHIVKGLDVPVVPVHLDRVWGSIFSFAGDQFFFKLPRKLPYPVTVSFGAALSSSSSAGDVRRAVLDLGAEAFSLRLAETPSLGVAFVRAARRRWRRRALADSMGKDLTFLKALMGSLAVGEAVRARWPGNAPLALLLPPSVGGALANLGTVLEGRTTVNLNYTASRETALDCARRARAAGILTSKRFIEKLGWEASPEMVFLEDLAAAAPRLSPALRTAALMLLPRALGEALALSRARVPLDDTATIIFTSGSTGSPKGVMLSHRNIQANIEALGQIYQALPNDVLLGVLPFFHSFGHTGALWFPMTAGFAAVYHPNPLDAKVVGKLTREFSATFLLGTPSFLAGYMRRVDAADFKSLRTVVVGAEKLREEVALAFKEKYGLTPLEGYGSTELSPVASLNVPDVRLGSVHQTGTKLGTIGHPLPGVRMKIVDPESGAELPIGTAGLLLVKGPNVMKGYLDDPQKTAEVMRDGYYITGDIASFDEDGYLTITDRLSRFSKVAGEMVPHIKVEEELHKAVGTLEQTFVVAAVPDEKRGERLVVLTKGPQDVDALLAKLKAAGLPNLWIPGKECFHPVEGFPLLGSGKLDMNGLKAKARELEKVS